MDFDLCTPAKFYLFFAVLSFLTAMFYGQSSLFIIVQLFVSVAWVAGLNFLCKSGYNTVAWAVTLIPVWIGIIAYGLTFIALNNSGQAGGTYAPTPGDFTHLKAATLADIINSIVNQFTSKAQFDIKPVFDQTKCNAANALVSKGWGTHAYTTSDTLGPYYTEVTSDTCADATACGPTSGVSGGSSSAWGTTANTNAATAVGLTHRPIQATWAARVAACQGGAPTN